MKNPALMQDFFVSFNHMKKKKILKIIAIVLGSLTFIMFALYTYAHYTLKNRFTPSENVYTKSAEYINRGKALLYEGFAICDENFILQYYNPERATYSEGKNKLRSFILSNYINKNYTDSGYLNIRFIINCKGEAGCYVIHENDLNLKPKKFSSDLKDQLFKLTIQLKKWNPNYYNNEYRDSYMYLSYRIENGEITEIIP